MDCSCLASLTVVIGEPVWRVVIKDGCGEWRQDWVNRKRQERWKAVVLMRCPEERRRLFFTPFVTQVSRPAQLDRRQDTPSFWSSSHNLSSFAFVCVALLHILCSVYLSSYTDLCISNVSSIHSSSSDFVCVWIIFLSLLFAACQLLMPFVRKKKKKIIALTCRSGIENNCWFQGAWSAFN